MQKIAPHLTAFLLFASIVTPVTAQSTSTVTAIVEPPGCHAYLVFPPDTAPEIAAAGYPGQNLVCEPQPVAQMADRVTETDIDRREYRTVIETVLPKGVRQ